MQSAECQDLNYKISFPEQNHGYQIRSGRKKPQNWMMLMLHLKKIQTLSLTIQHMHHAEPKG